MGAQRSALKGGIRFQRPVAFWLGVVALTTGTVMHLPMFFGAAEMGYRLVGMPIDRTMIFGMFLILAGLAAATYGLFPDVDPAAREQANRIQVRTLDDARLASPHYMLLAVLAVAVLIDIIKPTTLAFVVPGMAEEYGLKTALNPDGTIPVSLLPLFGIGGTVIGSFVWGWLADRMGRRSTILLAALLFIATSICGSMPTFGWNLFMCFVMGLSVGGMLPIAYTLTAETIPARKRGLLMIMIGGDLSLAFFVTSWLSSWLQPQFGWRVMWLIGAPTGVLLIMMSRWIPESPRFLIATGQRAEAEKVMARFRAEIIEVSEPEREAVTPAAPRYSHLMRRPLGGLSLGIGLYALAFGLVQFGFLLWLPTNLRNAGLEAAAADSLVARASLLGFPITFLVAFLYGFWSSKKTLLIFAGLTCATLFGFVFLGDRVTTNPLVLQALIVVVIMGVSTATTDLMPTYAAEVYPTRLRGRGSGFVAGASKVGGVLGIGLVVAAVTPPTFSGAAMLGAVPMLIAILALGAFGVETRRRRLEEISASLEGVAEA